MSDSVLFLLDQLRRFAGAELADQVAALLELMSAGGAVVYLLLTLSLVVATVSVVKFAQFLTHGVFSGARARDAVRRYRAGDAQGALSRLQNRRDIRSTLLAEAFRARDWQGMSRDQAREEVERQALDRLDALKNYLRTLELIGALAPLLGLFGTVLGMISAFRQLETAGANVDPSVLSGGIWLALLTTAVGLAVAMPAVGLLGFFDRCIERLGHDLDNMIAQVFLERG